ncbi:MAG TPA: hypothetical protein VF170_02220, partial [Planctomycetaceae bacterium]
MPRPTAAVDRVLARAVANAKRRAAGAVEPVDLLAALLAEESRGAELLARFGIHVDDAETATLLGAGSGGDPAKEGDELDLLTPALGESGAYL